MTPQARRALELRKQLSKGSVSKLVRLLDTVSPDGRLRHSYKYYGAHTGRWSAGGVDSPTAQLQNLPRGVLSPEEVTRVSDAIREGRLTAATLDEISSCLRSAFRAPEGSLLVVADLKQIEVRVLAWLAGCVTLCDVCEKEDPYIDFAARLYKKMMAEVSKHERQVAKSAVLGCGFQLSGGEIRQDQNGDDYKSGLWGYAENMGVAMTQQEAIDAVRLYRATYPEVTLLWRKLEGAAVQAMLHPGERVIVGKLTFFSAGGGVWKGLADGSLSGTRKILAIELPSGRRLHYPRPKLTPGQWDDGTPRVTISYEGLNLGQWKRIGTFGGRLAENVVQAVARDVLAEGMLRADERGFEIVGHCHDELITLGPGSLDLLIQCMTETLPWAPDLTLAADGWTGVAYRK